MRIACVIALGALSLFGFAQSNAGYAADAAVATPNSSAFSKTPAPQPSRLAPPQPGRAPVQAPAAQAAQPLSTPQPTAAAQSAPESREVDQGAPEVTARGDDADVPYQGTPETSYDRPSLQLQGPAHLQGPATPSYGAPSAPPAGPADFASAERLLDWVSNYRDKPQYWKVPAAVHAMRDHRLFTDEEQRWFCIGFIAGVLGTNPNDGPGLIPQMFPMPPKEQEVIIRAIAYSGRPDWQDLLVKNADRMPLRKPLIDDLLNGRRPTLQAMELDTGGTTAVYALWGYYVASGQYEPVMRIMQALKWSKGAQEAGFFEKLASGWGKDANNVEKVTTGGTAKWTLASYAERDRDLIDLYRAEIVSQPEEIAGPLKDVIEAASLFEAEKIRKEQYGAIEDAERQQLTADAGMSKGWTAGSIAIATGCMAATALGQAQIAVPCVIGGALYSGAGKLAR
ncbi:hypothetical protein [Methyloceanibacter caenitepidi]|uniref:Uncharacterized protein n=1 Tax=Methyloceanibacter caenitepidi TaxID=1384459 RepID=A0A0A8K1F9_9HYPH|nr:hypothetical protein [Methyloceanibacter caenitepidi]BAQ16322.1 hypothetical protein GL4_0861 [Methyloceanibacter caenitepidi]